MPAPKFKSADDLDSMTLAIARTLRDNWTKMDGDEVMKKNLFAHSKGYNDLGSVIIGTNGNERVNEEMLSLVLQTFEQTLIEGTFANKSKVIQYHLEKYLEKNVEKPSLTEDEIDGWVKEVRGGHDTKKIRPPSSPLTPTPAEPIRPVAKHVPAKKAGLAEAISAIIPKGDAAKGSWSEETDDLGEKTVNIGISASAKIVALTKTRDGAKHAATGEQAAQYIGKMVAESPDVELVSHTDKQGREHDIGKMHATETQDASYWLTLKTREGGNPEVLESIVASLEKAHKQQATLSR